MGASQHVEPLRPTQDLSACDCTIGSTTVCGRGMPSRAVAITHQSPNFSADSGQVVLGQQTCLPAATCMVAARRSLGLQHTGNRQARNIVFLGAVCINSDTLLDTGADELPYWFQSSLERYSPSSWIPTVHVRAQPKSLRAHSRVPRVCTLRGLV